VTEIFKAGEHVQITLTDYGYSAELGENQVGLVGTVVNGNPSGSVDITFPHTGDKEFFFTSNEIRRAPGTTPLPEPLKEGDWVKVVNHTSTWDGTVVRITSFDGEEGVHAANDKFKRGLYFLRENLELTEAPVPVAKFAIGDWVKVEDYSTTWNGVKGQITMAGGYDSRGSYFYIIKTHDFAYASTGGFDEKYLKATTAPFIAKYKVGDWVEVTGCCSLPTCNGTKWQIKEVPTADRTYYHLENDDRTANYTESFLKTATKPEPKPKFKAGDWVEINGWSADDGEKLQVKTVPASVEGFYAFENKPVSYGFRERFLKATTAPVGPHWTETEPVHSAIRIGGRTVVKVAADQWLFLYHDGSYSEKIDSMRIRNNEDTRNVFGSAKPSHAFSTPN